MKEQEIKMNVEAIFKANGKLVTSEEDSEVVAVAVMPDEAHYVTVGTSRRCTINLGNYESATFSVEISTPCPAEESQIENAYQFISDFCEGKLKEKIAEIETKTS